jgi:carboxymethylenebutenolidase
MGKYMVAGRRRRVPRNAEDLVANACPIEASNGARDRTVGEAPARLKPILHGSGVDHDVRVYPDVGHSFMNNHPGKLATFAGAAGKDAALPPVFMVVSLLSGR